MHCVGTRVHDTGHPFRRIGLNFGVGQQRAQRTVKGFGYGNAKISLAESRESILLKR